MQLRRNNPNASLKVSNVWLRRALLREENTRRSSPKSRKEDDDVVSPLKAPWRRNSRRSCAPRRDCVCSLPLDRRVCLGAGVRARSLECVRYLHEVRRSWKWAALQSSDDTLPLHFLFSLSQTLCRGLAVPTVVWLGEIFFRMWGSGRRFRRTGSHGESVGRSDRGLTRASRKGGGLRSLSHPALLGLENERWILADKQKERAKCKVFQPIKARLCKNATRWRRFEIGWSPVAPWYNLPPFVQALTGSRDAVGRPDVPVSSLAGECRSSK